MSLLAELSGKIADRSARVGVIGLGYVGLPLALVFEEAGFPVTGFDVDPAKTEALARGESYIRHIGKERVARAFARRRLEATTDFDRLPACDAVVVCVPTPLGRHREPDLSFIRTTADAIARRLRPGQLVVLESTTYPGTTREELLPRFAARGLAPGSDFFLAFSPEREDPGNRSFQTHDIPKVVGGLDPASQQAAVALYSAAVAKVVPVSSPEVAEAAKLLENIFRAVNIALANEMKLVLERMGIDVWEVIEAARTKPFGFMPFYPGPGLGGHCIPLDPFYLAWKAAEHGVWARFIELAGEVNTAMPHYVVDRTARALNTHGRSLRGSRVLVLGLSYKADIDDDRESPSFEIIELLREAGAEVAYCDPYIPVARPGRAHDIGLSSVPCSAEEFARHDAVVVSTAHSDFRRRELFRSVRLVIDTRNLMAPLGFGQPGAAGPEVVRA
ncbi:MAG TPA: nucleotide sugar dehydrogenase [Vicinamibacteria bacterium]|nr:nucleotide sugar dehydrogenase [Vicinamibacteria bacterium]